MKKFFTVAVTAAITYLATCYFLQICVNAGDLDISEDPEKCSFVPSDGRFYSEFLSDGKYHYTVVRFRKVD